MSYILEALKKSDAERKRGEVPTLGDTAAATPPSASGGKLNVRLMAIAGIVLLIVLGGGSWLLLGGSEPAKPARDLAEAPPQKQVQDQEPQVAAAARATAAPEVTSAPESELVSEPVSEPAPEPVSQAAPEAAPETPAEPEPIAEPKPEPEPVAEAQDVAVLRPKPAPAPSVEQAVPPIPEPVAVAEPEPQPATAAKTARAPALPRLDSAEAYVDRAWASMDKGLFARALSDLDTAVKMEPAFADAWFARGWAHEKNGDTDQAISDYGRAIDAKPDHAFALFSRGYLNLYSANPRDAVLDFVRTQGVAQDASLRLYSHLWLYMSRARAGENAQARIKDDASGDSLTAWPGPLVLHYMGALDEGAVLNAIDQGPATGLKERRATGYFFLGVLAGLSGNDARARQYYEKTLATGAVTFRQYDAARRELARMR